MTSEFWPPSAAQKGEGPTLSIYCRSHFKSIKISLHWQASEMALDTSVRQLTELLNGSPHACL